MSKKNIKKTVVGDNDYTERYKDKSYMSLRNDDASRLVSQISSLNIFKSGDKVLDAGCGSGEFGAAVKNSFNARVYGIDINEEAVKKSNKNGLIAQIADIEQKLPYRNESFNSVLCVQMIEHLINPDFFLTESKRVLKKNGLLIITTPNLAAWFNRIILLFGYQPFFTEISTIDKTLGLSFTRKLTPNRKPLGHLRVFTLKALIELLQMHDFKILKVKGSTVSYFPKYVYFFDKLFSHFPSIATDLIVIAKKKEK
ncbi:MAG: class I SAM-dependent methyltransferase [Patescibacteria group bacterium]|nr:class I SAM-dependent methyltransferase [Patescibacteria group bacterium]